MTDRPATRLVALSGGVGGARFVDGLRTSVLADNLLIVANTGDDFTHLGLPICPDLDTVMYTLADRENPTSGWGRREETWHCLNTMRELGADTWFQLGDKDLATHLYRAQLLQQGLSLTDATRVLCDRFGVRQRLVPMTDSMVRTMVETATGEMSFQHYFVRNHCEPEVRGFRFDGVASAAPSPSIADFIAERAVDAIIIAPSNPFVSIDPVLAVPGMRELLLGLHVPIIAVSPIIGGRAIKGPAAKMLSEMGRTRSASAVAEHYAGFASGFVIDEQDAALADEISSQGMDVLVTDTLIVERPARMRLATEILSWCRR